MENSYTLIGIVVDLLVGFAAGWLCCKFYYKS